MAQHTPGPWVASANGVHRGTACVATTHMEPREQRVADAEFIARACNLHDSLLIELQQAHTEVEEAAKLLAGSGLTGMASIYRAAAERIAGTLAKSEAA